MLIMYITTYQSGQKDISIKKPLYNIRSVYHSPMGKYISSKKNHTNINKINTFHFLKIFLKILKNTKKLSIFLNQVRRLPLYQLLPIIIEWI